MYVTEYQQDQSAEASMISLHKRKDPRGTDGPWQERDISRLSAPRIRCLDRRRSRAAWSKAKISRIETGKGPVRVADIRALCWLYGADTSTTEALAALAPGTQQEDWWQDYGQAVVPDWFGLYAGLEAAASRLARTQMRKSAYLGDDLDSECCVWVC
jgi:hypothetical protein